MSGIPFMISGSNKVKRKRAGGVRGVCEHGETWMERQEIERQLHCLYDRLGGGSLANPDRLLWRHVAFMDVPFR